MSLVSESYLLFPKNGLRQQFLLSNLAAHIKKKTLEMLHILWKMLQTGCSHSGQRKENIFNISIPVLSILNIFFLACTNRRAEFWLNKSKDVLCYSKVRSKCCVKPSEKSCGFIFNLSWHAAISWSKKLFAKTCYILLLLPLQKYSIEVCTLCEN